MEIAGSERGFLGFFLSKIKPLEKLMISCRFFGKALEYHFYPRSKPAISTSVGLFKRGLYSSPSLNVSADNTSCPAFIELFCFVVFSPTERLGKGKPGLKDE